MKVKEKQKNNTSNFQHALNENTFYNNIYDNNSKILNNNCKSNNKIIKCNKISNSNNINKQIDDNKIYNSLFYDDYLIFLEQNVNYNLTFEEYLNKIGVELNKYTVPNLKSSNNYESEYNYGYIDKDIFNKEKEIQSLENSYEEYSKYIKNDLNEIQNQNQKNDFEFMEEDIYHCDEDPKELYLRIQNEINNEEIQNGNILT